MFNPNYPIQVDGWRGVVRQESLEPLDQERTVKDLIESAHQSYPSPVPVFSSHHEPYSDLT